MSKPSNLQRVLRRRRKALGLTQQQLAKLAGTTRGHVAQLEIGIRTNPSLSVLKRLARALRVPLIDLL